MANLMQRKVVHRSQHAIVEEPESRFAVRELLKAFSSKMISLVFSTPRSCEGVHTNRKMERLIISERDVIGRLYCCLDKSSREAIRISVEDEGDVYE